jgi:hypothetical protein
VNQFGVFLALGATGEVVGNTITQGNCGNIAATACVNQRSEGVVLRSTGNNVYIALNVIGNVQYGIFVNGATAPFLNANIINNVDFNGVQIQAFDYNWVNDAYSGIGYTGGDLVGTDNYYFNTLYQTLDLDDYVTTPNPPPTEPGQSSSHLNLH